MGWPGGMVAARMNEGSFKLGFLLGFVLAGALGWAANRFRTAQARRQRPKRPMSVQTDSTPAQVVAASQGACLSMVVWSLVLLVLLGAAIFVFLQ
jgi:sterol desaturase/sphingolipid hydroxylase (fatty acid hydroxylase superfamily)